MIARSTSWRCTAAVLGCLLVQAGMAQRTSAQNTENQERSYFLGTATTGGTYHPVGVALSTLIKLKLLPAFNVDLTAINTSGSQENATLMRQGDIQFGIISALAGHDARTGAGQFLNAGPDENLRAIMTLWLSTDHLVVREDAVQSGTVEDFLELQGRNVSLGREDSGTLLGNRTLMSSLGVDVDTSFNLVELGYAESAQALINSQIDGMSVSGGVPVGAVQDVFEALGDKAVVLEFSDEQLALLDRGRGLWTRATIPADTYSGQNREIFTAGSPNLLAVRADVDDEVVYEITKTIFEELEYLHGLHGATRQISLDNAANNLPLPLHAGAIRYFEEKGVELPPPPVELNPDLLVRYDGAVQAREQVNRGVISLFSGTEGDTSTRASAELASVLNTADSDVRLLATYGGGIGQNLIDLLYLKGVDAALVRADVLAYAEEKNVYPSIQNQVTYIAGMFPEEVHLVVRDDISDMSDLIGQKVNLGSPGSGSDITASIILSRLGLNVQTTAFDPYNALDKLRRGEIAAAFFVGGKPMPLLQQIESGSGLKLLPVPFVQYGDSYRSAEIVGHDYPDLLAPDDVVPTIAVRTALLTYAWRPQSARYVALTNFTNALFSNLRTLHGESRHPKWREVDPTAEFAGWQRFAPARAWIDDNPGTAQAIAAEGRRLIERSEESGIELERQEIQEPSSLDAAISPEAPVDEPQIPIDSPQERQDQTQPVIAPAAPRIEIAPTIEAEVVTPPTNGATYERPPKFAVSPRPTVTQNLPAAAANAPTF